MINCPPAHLEISLAQRVVFQFLEACTKQTPDIYLLEFWQELKETCRTSVSEVTIT
ncbi:hypothetical protein PAXRUDRAFT_136111 [Paxillus rubicundulus Ve08.2h10]|uniref:Uncharacterized protein n=1 Tax=Paxillus rubicundulus Ve08.2h10 TaxID=930991 RepID=A0A0D0DH96_9AGAM|nr:hypothetical protein PAXRUDRAFT_136111 [Paxillus rubicundulus Ve08.2h10]